MITHLPGGREIFELYVSNLPLLQEELRKIFLQDNFQVKMGAVADWLNHSTHKVLSPLFVQASRIGLDFFLLKDFFDDVIFLPQVKLQKNNPGRVTITGTANDYELVNTYQYNSKQLPLSKTTRMKQVRGTGSGQEVVLTDHYSYY